MDPADYINVALLCQRVGHAWTDWRSSPEGDAYLQAASQVLGLLITEIVINNEGATWLHPVVAVEFLQWLSPRLRVWVFQQVLTDPCSRVELPDLWAMLDRYPTYNMGRGN